MADILIIDQDIFGAVGGGQSAYARLVARQPEHRFFYFSEREAPGAPRPANATAIPLPPIPELPWLDLPARHHPLHWDWHVALHYAASVAAALPGQSFDVVDTPDYRTVGVFLRSAFEAHGVRFGHLALAMHGTLSAAFRGGWPSGQAADDRTVLASLFARERLQFRLADIRYAISPQYAAAWQRRAPLPVWLLDPLSVAGPTDALPMPSGDGPPDLLFLGRHEKWKGPDLFLDLAWCLDHADYGRLILAGPDGKNRLGGGGTALLASMAQMRGLTPEVPGGLTQAEVRALFASRSLLLAPSRVDTFNLTVMEAALAGCPVLVSHRAGVAAWLAKSFPGGGWAAIGLDCSRSAASDITAMLRGYEAAREKLATAPRPVADEASLQGLYLHPSRPDWSAQRSLESILRVIRGANLNRKAQMKRSGWRMAAWPVRLTGKAAKAVITSAPVRGAANLLPAGLKRQAGQAVALAENTLRRARGRNSHDLIRLVATTWFERRGKFSPSVAAQVAGARRVPMLTRLLAEMPERSGREVDAKLAVLSRLVPQLYPDRVRLFRAMAALEDRRGGRLTAAIYLLRTMRWLGQDARGELSYVKDAFAREGFRAEARTAEAMFAPMPEPDRQARMIDLMRGAHDDNRHNAERPLAMVEDRRGNAAPRVSVIVSLYNAADKLPTMMNMLARQTLATLGGVEVVLVDSNSPADERGAFRAFADANPDLPIVYARSAERETIQAAWNRGIHLSRAPYLSFLGADEGLHPDALRQLAATLDDRPGVDWAMADSIVTSVDRDGVFDQDVMAYDRRGFRQDMTYLETCYLSWVGGLYRRTIHDRVGWYDESFRAAGDTEFKNRIMPHIRSVHVPQVLGVFNNYPEERTTQHPRAEVEDTRAWYLWRTQAGMEYAFSRRPVEDAEALFRDALNYRKSYCGHLSSDFDLAHALAGYIASRPDAPPEAGARLNETAATLERLRAMEELAQPQKDTPGGLARIRATYAAVQGLREQAPRHAALFGLQGAPHYEMFNDNRYEQHWWSWS